MDIDQLSLLGNNLTFLINSLLWKYTDKEKAKKLQLFGRILLWFYCKIFASIANKKMTFGLPQR